MNYEVACYFSIVCVGVFIRHYLECLFFEFWLTIASRPVLGNLLVLSETAFERQVTTRLIEATMEEDPVDDRADKEAENENSGIEAAHREDSKHYELETKKREEEAGDHCGEGETARLVVRSKHKDGVVTIHDVCEAIVEQRNDEHRRTHHRINEGDGEDEEFLCVACRVREASHICSLFALFLGFTIPESKHEVDDQVFWSNEIDEMSDESL